MRQAQNQLQRQLVVGSADPQVVASVEAKIQNPAALSNSVAVPVTAVWTLARPTPVVAGDILVGLRPITFGEFLRLPHVLELFTTGDCRVFVNELQKAREFPYFGIDAGLFRAHKTRTRKALTKYVRRVYRGSARGVSYWSRIAKLVWLAYENFVQLRYWAQRTQTCEVLRLERKATRAWKEKRRLKLRHQRKPDLPTEERASPETVGK